MLARQFRLVKDADFGAVMTKGRGVKNSQGQVKFLSNQLKNSRFGIVVSNKVAKKATVRNLLKRRLREALRALLPEMRRGYDVVVITYPGLVDKEFAEIKEFLSQAFEKLNLFEKNNG